MSSRQSIKPELVIPPSGQIKVTAKSGLEILDTVTFLGYEWSKEEYRVIARNLADYFSILKKWRQQEGRSEEEENL